MATDRNGRYVKHLMSAIGGIPKKLQARLTIVAYKAAILTTHQDSGRAAFNWHLKIGAGEAFKKGDWRQKSTRYSGVSGTVVGAPGEKRRAGHRAVSEFKLQEYGLKSYAVGGQGGKADAEGSSLYKRIYGKGPGRAPKVTLYNPIWSTRNPMYVDYAFDDHRVSSRIDRAIHTQMTRLKSEMKRGIN